MAKSDSLVDVRKAYVIGDVVHTAGRAAVNEAPGTVATGSRVSTVVSHGYVFCMGGGRSELPLASESVTSQT